MKHLTKYCLFLLVILGFLTSCDESRKRATDRLNEFSEQADDLNTQIDKGLKEIKSLDSTVRKGAERIKEYDSVVEKGTSRIDSIAKAKAKAWEELTTY